MKRFNLLLTILFTLNAFNLFAQAGTLDPSFGKNGLVKTSFIGFASTCAIQPDGKIVVAGRSEAKEFALARFDPDGSLDETFGSGGIVTTKVGSVEDHLFSIALQSDGKIVAAGYSQNPNFVHDFALARYDSDGSLDSTFGNNGLVVTEFNMGFGDYVIRSVAIQSDGKIVAAGSVKYEKSGQFAMTRYNEDGSLDNHFGTSGKLLTDFTSGLDWARAVLLLPDGKIIVGGSSDGMFTNANFAIAQYRSNGNLDNSFGANGKVMTDFTNTKDLSTSLALQPDGKIIAVGQTWVGMTMDVALVRYNKDGSLENRFGTGGKCSSPSGGSSDLALDVALQADGKIIVVGHTRIDTNWNFAISRYNQDGSLDVSFGRNGQIITDINANNDMLLSVAIQADGKIVVAGTSGMGGINGSNGKYNSVFTLARYLSK